jgi:AraC-like DNA-binding protein
MTQPQSSAQRGFVDRQGLDVVRHESDLGFWESTSRSPHPRLRGLIEGSYQGWVEKSTRTMLRREVPSGIIPVIIIMGPAYGLLDPTGLARPRYVGSFVAGLHESFALTESPSFGMCLQVNFNPLGAYQLLGVPMHSLVNSAVALEDVLGQGARNLAARMQEAADWGSRFDMLDTFLAGRLMRAILPSPGMAWAWQQLKATGGLVDAGSLAAHIGCSHKHLITRFRRELGLPPKALARIIRFSRVTKMLGRNHVNHWARIAQSCGYYDQAHLIREFRSFAGSTPGEYLGRLLPDGGGVSGN